MKGACDVMIYMDNAATTKMHPDVVRAMLPYMGNRYGNPSGIYTFSKNIKKDITQARELLASTIGAGPDEIFLTPIWKHNYNTDRASCNFKNM